MSLQVQPGIGSEGAQGPDPAALEAQQAQQEAEMAANEASMKGQQEAQKIQAENDKLKMEAQQAKLEADQVKAQAQMEKEQLQSQKAVAQAEMAKMKAEQELVVEKSKTSQQDQSMKLLQEQAKAKEQQKDMQTETAMQQANLQAEQAKMQAQSQADQAGMQAEQAKMQAGMQAETAKAQQQDLASKSNLQQMMAQHDAQKAQSGAELSSRENQLGMKEQVLQEKAQMQPPAPAMHPSAVKLAKYASRMQRETGQFFFKSGTQQPAVTPPVTPAPTPAVVEPQLKNSPSGNYTYADFKKSRYGNQQRGGLADWQDSLKLRHGSDVTFTGDHADKLTRNYQKALNAPSADTSMFQNFKADMGERYGDMFDSWLAEGTGTPMDKRFWNTTAAMPWYGKPVGALADVGQGITSMYLRSPVRNIIAAQENAAKGDYLGAVGRGAAGLAQGALNTVTGGSYKLLIPAIGADMALSFMEPEINADRKLLAQREAQADKMMASIEAESKRNSPLNVNNYQHIPEDIRAQYMNRYAVDPSGMYSNFNPNQPQPGLFSFDTLASILSGLLTGGLQNRNMLAPRAPAPYDNYLQNSVGEYANRVQAGNQYNPYSG